MTPFTLFFAAALVPSGYAVLRAPAGASEIVLTTTPRLAGAVHSITWKGVEFIDSLDHGRQLQSAGSFDCAKPGPFVAECYNPTEAGSRKDGMGPKSTSRLLYLNQSATTLETRTRAAFWLAPGEKSEGTLALNPGTLSDHVITKRITLGEGGDPHRIGYTATFTIPPGEKHTLAQFEAVTGYMPAGFSKFWAFDPVTGGLSPLTDGPGEQSKPVILATPSGAHAMGIIQSGPPAAGAVGPGYGRWRFGAEKVVKWNAVYRITNPAGVPAGDYTFKLAVAVGSLVDVRHALLAVSRAAGPRRPPR